MGKYLYCSQVCYTTDDLYEDGTEVSEQPQSHPAVTHPSESPGSGPGGRGPPARNLAWMVTELV